MKKIKKNEAAVEAVTSEEEAFELKNIRVHEVSLVDRAANKRRFLVTKKASAAPLAGPDGEALTDAEKVLAQKDAEDAAEYAATKAAAEAAEVDPAIVEKDKADAAEYAATKETSAEEAPAVVTEAVPEAPAVETPAAVEAVAEEPAVKAEEPVVVPAVKADENSVPPILESRMQAAWLAGIEAIRERLDILSAAVKAGSNDPVNGSPDWVVWEHVRYLHSMLDGLCCIGGPEWDVQAAAVAATEKGEEGAAVDKAGRAISGARLSKLRDIQRLMTEARKAINALLSDSDGVATEKSEEPAASAPAVQAEAPVEKSAAPDAAELEKRIAADMEKRLASIQQAFDKQQAEMVATISKQAEQINRLRNVGRSNAIVREEPTVKKASNGADSVSWPMDMASPEARL